jgi:hypothetical protein
MYRIENDDDDIEEEEDGSIRETRALAGLETQTSLEPLVCFVLFYFI